MVLPVHARIRKVYEDHGFLVQQKALAFMWVCSFVLVSLIVATINNIIQGPGTILYYVVAMTPILILAVACVVAVLRGKYLAVVGPYMVCQAVLHVAGGMEAVMMGLTRDFYSGFALYTYCVVLCAAIFASRRVFLLAAVLELCSITLFHHLLPGQNQAEFALNYEPMLLDHVVSLLIVCGVSWGFVSIVDRALSRVEDELETNRQLREGLERMVEERTAALDRALHAAESANRSKSAFLANISHEIRTPLHGIMGMADLVLENALDDAQRAHVGIISDSSRHLLSVIQDILDYSRIEAGTMALYPEDVDLGIFLRGVVDPLVPLAQDKAIDLRLELGGKLPSRVRFDGSRVRQILTNLLGNALKFTERGSVVLRAAILPDSVLEFSVEDTGIGIAPSELEAIFERFRQADETTGRRFGGSGLGLAISRQLAEAMGGTLQAQSALGGGSRFTARIPYLPCAEEDAPLTDGPVAESGFPHGIRILVVDDNAINRRVASGLLSKAGCRVTEADDGGTALECLASEDFDIVLMDCRMPGIDGVETTRILRSWSADPDLRRSRASRLPVVALTASALEDTRSECLAAGMDDLLVKPFRASQLRGIVCEFQQGRRSARLV